VEDTTALTQVTTAALEVLVPVVIIFATWGAHRLIRLFETKTKIDVPQKQEDQIDAWIDRAILLAAEKARQKIHAKTEALKGPEKLEIAADFVYDLAQSRGWISWTKDLLKQKIEASLGIKRANGGVPVLDDK